MIYWYDFGIAVPMQTGGHELRSVVVQPVHLFCHVYKVQSLARLFEMPKL